MGAESKWELSTPIEVLNDRIRKRFSNIASQIPRETEMERRHPVEIALDNLSFTNGLLDQVPELRDWLGRRSPITLKTGGSLRALVGHIFSNWPDLHLHQDGLKFNWYDGDVGHINKTVTPSLLQKYWDTKSENFEPLVVLTKGEILKQILNQVNRFQAQKRGGLSSTKYEYAPNWYGKAEEVWELVLKQKQRDKVLRVGKEIALPFIMKTLKKMSELEESSQEPLNDRIRDSDVKETQVVWVISAPGTYYKPYKNDRYNPEINPEIRFDTSWWDKKRIDTGIEIARIIALRRIAMEDLPQDEEAQDEETLEILKNSAPYVVYNGRQDENTDFRKAVEDFGKKGIFPKNKVSVIDSANDDSYNTVAQVLSFALPPTVTKSGRLAIVSHSGQAVRLAYLLGNPKNKFPTELKPKFFITATKEKDVWEYHKLETAGIVYYTFTSVDASVDSCDYEF